MTYLTTWCKAFLSVISLQKLRLVALIFTTFAINIGFIAQPAAAVTSPAGGPATKWHYAPNGNFNGKKFIPAKYGFNVADVDSPAELAYLNANQKALVWIDKCVGKSNTKAFNAFKRQIDSYARSSHAKNILAFYLMDEPDSSGNWHAPKCPATNLKDDADYIHQKGYKSFITLMGMSSWASPTFAGSYRYVNTHVDYFGVSSYPCRTQNKSKGGCDFSEVQKTVTAAIKWLGTNDKNRIVPIYQTFGGGEWDAEGGKFYTPTESQEKRILAEWTKALGSTIPPFDFAYSYGVQRNDTAIATSGALQKVFIQHNK